MRFGRQIYRQNCRWPSEAGGAVRLEHDVADDPHAVPVPLGAAPLQFAIWAGEVSLRARMVLWFAHRGPPRLLGACIASPAFGTAVMTGGLARRERLSRRVNPLARPTLCRPATTGPDPAHPQRDRRAVRHIDHRPGERHAAPAAMVNLAQAPPAPR